MRTSGAGVGVGVGTDVGVLVGGVVGDGMGVAVGSEVGVAVGLAGARLGRLQARMENTSNRIGGSSFFMGRTIHGRGRGVKESAAISRWLLAVSC